MSTNRRHSRYVHTHNYDSFDDHILTVVRPGTSRIVRAALGTRTCGMAWLIYIGIATAGFLASAATGAANETNWWAACIVVAAAVAVRYGIIALAGGRGQLERGYHKGGRAIDVIDTTRVPYLARNVLGQIAEHHRAIIAAANGPAGTQVTDDMLTSIDNAIWDAAGCVETIDAAANELVAITGTNDAAGTRRTRRTDVIDAAYQQLMVYRDELAAIDSAATDADAEYRNLAELGLLELVVTGDLGRLERHDELVAAAEALHAAAEAARDVQAIDERTGATMAAVAAAAG